MKKVKIMLMSVAVVAVVGGALAFKAQKFDVNDFCTASLPEAGATCTSFLIGNVTGQIIPTMKFYYTPTTSTLDCTEFEDCRTSTTLTTKEF